MDAFENLANYTQTPPSDMAAVQHGGQNYIFFVDSQNRIAYYHGGNVQEYQGGDTYSKVNYLQVRTEDIRVTQLVNPNNKAIAAVAYTSATGKEVRSRLSITLMRWPEN